jgi:glutamyl-tRNA reductase
MKRGSTPMPADYAILLIGLNHKTASVEIREKLSFAKANPHPLQLLRERLKGLFKEAFFLSTCNRVEFCVVVEDQAKDKFLEEFRKFLAGSAGINHEELTNYLYVYEDDLAVKHLFEVACGLDSMVLGEPQILGQMKDAYKKALEYKSTGLFLNKLLHRCFFTAKRVRTETGLGSGAVSVSYAAVILAKKILGSLSDKTVLLIGAGEMAELACTHLLTHGASKILIANRTLSKAVELAEKFKGKAYHLSELKEVLTQADIVISSTGAEGFVVTKDLVASILRARKYRPLFIIDIAVPRDVEPKVNSLENVYLYDIDDLQAVVAENLKHRQAQALRAQAIIEEEVLKMKRWLAELSLHPTINRLTEKIEAIRKKELEKTLKRLRNLSPDEVKALEVLTQSLVQKVLYYPIKFLKEGYHEEGRLAVSLIREIFELDEPALEELDFTLEEFEETAEKRVH